MSATPASDATAAIEQPGTPMPPPGIAQPFSLDDADRLAGVLSEEAIGEYM